MLAIKDLSITRGVGEQSFTVSLPHLSLTEGEVIALCGSSGCGKSTLLEMIGLILKPDTLSQYNFDCVTLNMDLAPLIQWNYQKTLAEIRSKNLGFMLQNGCLLPFLSVWQNILLPCQTNEILADEVWLHHLCEKLNIGHLLAKYPKQLSIGERQRVAFVRSISHKPLLLLADEPTSALDPHHSEVLFHLMLSLAKQQKIAVLLVTHDWDLVQRNKLRTFSAKLDTALRQSCFIEQTNNDR